MTASDLPLRTASVALPAATNQRVGKRIFDVIVASLLLCLLSPVLAISWLLVRTTSPGGALFRQMRIGRLGHPFVMYKFRTMQAGCSDDIHREYVRKLLTDEPERTGGASGIYKLDADPRVTRIGRLSVATCRWWDRGLRCHGRRSCSQLRTSLDFLQLRG